MVNVIFHSNGKCHYFLMVVTKDVTFSFVCWFYLIQSLNPSAFVMLEFQLLFTPEVYGQSISDLHLPG